MEKEMICIMCPMACHLMVKKEGDEVIVSGNSCNRGAIFAKEELECPKRTLTTLVKTENGVKPCKTSIPVEKDKLFLCMKEIENLRLGEVHFGDVVIKNILGTGADVVITGE